MSISSASSVGDGADGRMQSQTASTIVAQTVSGSHVLTVDGYSQTKGLGNGKFIRSEFFTIGDHRWCIQYYPDGIASQHADWIAIHLRRNDNADGKEVMAKFRISLLDQDGTIVPSYSQESNGCDKFSPKGGCGFDRFIRTEDLEESTCLRDDGFRMKCEVTITKKFHTAVSETCTTEQFVVVPPSNLHQHLLGLLTSKHGGDVIFQVDGESFTGHRYILAARSPVFTAELFGSMKERTASCVQITGMEAKVFKGMLHFIYTDSLPGIDDSEIVEMAQHLLVAADRYDLERLKLICEEMLCNHVNMNTVVNNLALAEYHGCGGLRKACFKFLASPGILMDVMAGDNFERLASSSPSLLRELLAMLAR